MPDLSTPPGPPTILINPKRGGGRRATGGQVSTGTEAGAGAAGRAANAEPLWAGAA
jgi:hypothetical protein